MTIPEANNIYEATIAYYAQNLHQIPTIQRNIIQQANGAIEDQTVSMGYNSSGRVVLKFNKTLIGYA